MTQPPVAKRIPVERRVHDDVTVDEYAWLRDRDDPDVLAYLEAENAWTDHVLAPAADLEQQLFEEIRSRVLETDLTVPVRHGDWWYYHRTAEDLQYPIHCRKAAAPDEVAPADDTPEQVLLDENLEAGDGDYFAVGAFDVNPDHRRLLWSSDATGGETYELRIRDLPTGRDLDEVIAGTYYGTAWAGDDTCFYTRPDASMRSFQVWRHIVGTDPADDVLVFQEDDERFHVGVGETRDRSHVLVESASKVTTEVLVLRSADPLGEFRVVASRRQGVEYEVEHHGDRFLVVTNAEGAEDFQLVEAPDDDPSPERWQTLVPGRDAVRLDGVDPFAGHLVRSERASGATRLVVHRLADGAEHEIEGPDVVGTFAAAGNPEFATTTFRYTYQSLVTPASVFDHDLETGRSVLRKQTPVLGGFEPEAYRTERLWAPAGDGTEVPVTLVTRRDRPADGLRPLVLYGYGSYEISIDPWFSHARLSLLDRGWAFAVAHVRGGGEMGRRWYLDGKLDAKANSFQDFIACGRHLVETGWATPEGLVARGGSAGGLLVGAVANLAPELFAAVVAEVPFVDALNTILDPTLPLTATEWEEWGNPIESADVYRLMRSYSPFENVEAKDYPAMFVTAGLNDPRVSYWEPAKWVARLRATKTDTRPLLLETELGAGHQGPSGRYDAWRKEARVLAFLLTVVGEA